MQEVPLISFYWSHSIRLQPQSTALQDHLHVRRSISPQPKLVRRGQGLPVASRDVVVSRFLIYSGLAIADRSILSPSQRTRLAKRQIDPTSSSALDSIADPRRKRRDGPVPRSIVVELIRGRSYMQAEPIANEPGHEGQIGVSGGAVKEQET